MGLTTQAPSGAERQAAREAVIAAALGVAHVEHMPPNQYRDRVLELRELALDVALRQWAALDRRGTMSPATD